MRPVEAPSWLGDAGLALLARALAPGELLVTGGAVRDALAGIEPDDFDVVAALPAPAGRAALDAAGIAREAHPFMPDVDFVSLPGKRVRDVSLGYAGSRAGLDADARRRDFTCNAVYLTLDGDLVDPLGGAADLRAGILRPTGPDAFERDPVRILRAPRMLRLAGGVEARGLRGAMAAAAPRLAECPPIRVVRELSKLLDLSAAEEAVADVGLLAATGALRAIYPEADPPAFAAYCRMCAARGFDSGDEAPPRLAVLGLRPGQGYDGRVAAWGDWRDDALVACAGIAGDGPDESVLVMPGAREALFTFREGKRGAAAPRGLDPGTDPD